MNSEEKLDYLLHTLQEVRVTLESVKGSLAVLLNASDDHETRLRTIERWQNKLTPFLAIGTFVCGAIFQIAFAHWI